MRTIRLTPDQAIAHAQAVGDLQVAEVELAKVRADLLADYEINPKTPCQIVGDVLTVQEAPSHA